MRSLLTVVALLSIVLFSVGTAHAILGVADDVPGQDLVWPILCVKTPTASNNLNTNWAITDVIGGTNTDTGLPHGNLVQTRCTLCTINSACSPDFFYEWTPYDVVVDNCKALVATRTPIEQTGLTVTNDTVGLPLPGGPYYAGYIKCIQDNPGGVAPNGVSNVRDRFMNNVYLVDTPLGFASGFNGPSAELGLTATLGEDTAQEVTAHDVYLRYYLDNTNANTWDWWMLLAGRNQYNSINISSSRNLACEKFCDEEENCVSLNLPIPNELNIINIGAILPGTPLDTTFPRAGFAACTISEGGTRNTIGFSGGFTLNGTVNNPTIAGGVSYYSLYGWSWQRVAVTGSVIGDYDVIHPMFRRYCSGSTVATTVPGAFAPDNQDPCVCTPGIGNGC